VKKGNNKPKKSPATPGSLLAPEAMGGINAGKGFDFQTRYTACNVPLWLLEAAFHQLFFEGTGDIDIRFTEAGKSSRIHIQVKDHDVSPSELKSVIEQFSLLDSTVSRRKSVLRRQARDSGSHEAGARRAAAQGRPG